MISIPEGGLSKGAEGEASSEVASEVGRRKAVAGAKMAAGGGRLASSSATSCTWKREDVVVVPVPVAEAEGSDQAACGRTGGSGGGCW